MPFYLLHHQHDAGRVRGGLRGLDRLRQPAPPPPRRLDLPHRRPLRLVARRRPRTPPPPSRCCRGTSPGGRCRSRCGRSRSREQPAVGTVLARRSSGSLAPVFRVLVIVRNALICGDFSSHSRPCDNPVGFCAGAPGIDRSAGRHRPRVGCDRDVHRGARAVDADDRDDAGGADRLHLLVRDGDLAVRVRGRRGDPDLLADQLPRQGPGRLVRRPADPRAHDARDRLDDHPDDPRDRDRHRQRHRARAEQQRRRRSAQDRTSIAQQFAWQFNYADGKTYPMLRAADRPQGRAHADGQRRDPLVLGAAVRAEAGRRAGDRRRRS